MPATRREGATRGWSPTRGYVRRVRFVRGARGAWRGGRRRERIRLGSSLGAAPGRGGVRAGVRVRHAGDERRGALGHDVRGCRAGDRVRHAGDERGGALDGERADEAGDGERASPFVDGVADAACPGTAPAVARPGAAAARAAISRRVRGGIVPEGDRRSRGSPGRRHPRNRSPSASASETTRRVNRATEEGQRPRLVPRIAPRGSRGRGCSRRRSTTRRRCRRP